MEFEKNKVTHILKLRFHNFIWIFGSSLKTGKGVYTGPEVHYANSWLE